MMMIPVPAECSVSQRCWLVLVLTHNGTWRQALNASSAVRGCLRRDHCRRGIDHRRGRGGQSQRFLRGKHDGLGSRSELAAIINQVCDSNWMDGWMKGGTKFKRGEKGRRERKGKRKGKER